MGRHGTIAGRKDKQDAKRGQLFTKYGRLITVAAKAGGDMDYNVSLKHAVDKAKAVNMPNDTINRAIKRGTGELEGATYEQLTYEGYGPGGVAIIIDTLTDNKNRTGSAVRMYLDRNNGNLGVTGCVTYIFERKGQLIIEKTDAIDEDQLMEHALEAGMEDMITHDDCFEILTAMEDFDAVKEALEAEGYAFVEADLELIPNTTTVLEKPGDIKAMRKLIDMLEENDDIQKVYHNWEEPEEA